MVGGSIGFLACWETIPALNYVAASSKRAIKAIPEFSDRVQEWNAYFGSESWWLSPALVVIPGTLIGAFLVNPMLERFFHWFNSWFDRTGRLYVRVVRTTLRVPLLVLVGYGGALCFGAIGYGFLPTGFIPQQDKGYLIASIQLPDAAATDRTREKIQRITKTILDFAILVESRKGEEGAEQLSEPTRRDGKPALPDEQGDILEAGQWVRRIHPVRHCNSVIGNSFVLSAYGSNFGSMFIILDGYENRQDKRLYADEVRMKLGTELDKIVPEAQVNLFGAPAVSGLGRAGGFRIMIEDRGDVGPEVLREQTDDFIAKTKTLPQVTG
ncbi:MAG TPA: efflux RND transporter permease subunit, partial [Gemmata sp.]|nr:efflux RND transporter permease subunit [Gemmata sp.]